MRNRDAIRSSNYGSVRNFLVYYLVQQPLASVATVWVLCFPMVYLTYGNLVESATTLAAITVIFLLYLMTAIAVMVLIALSVEYAFSRRDRRFRGR